MGIKIVLPADDFDEFKGSVHCIEPYVVTEGKYFNIKRFLEDSNADYLSVEDLESIIFAMEQYKNAMS